MIPVDSIIIGKERGSWIEVKEIYGEVGERLYSNLTGFIWKGKNIVATEILTF